MQFAVVFMVAVETILFCNKFTTLKYRKFVHMVGAAHVDVPM